MVLLVGGEKVDAASLLLHLSVQTAAAAFLSQPAAAAVTPSTAKKLIYACQGEEASCRPEEDAVLSTSDATTCVCLVLVPLAAGAEAAQGSVAGSVLGSVAGSPPIQGPRQQPAALARVVHHDEGTALRATVAGLGQHTAQLWMVGAYADARGTGARVAARLLRFLERCPARLEVRLACLGPLNTAPDGSPRATALSVDLRTLTASPAAPDPLHLRGPLLPARMKQWVYRQPGSSRSSSGSSSGSDAEDPRSHPLRSIYNAARGQLELRLRQGRPPAYMLQFARQMAALPDDQLLQQYSTSPLHEPHHFVADMRASFEWLLQQTGPVRSVTHRFNWAPGGWQPATPGVAASAAPVVEPAAGGEAAEDREIFAVSSGDG